MKYLYLLVLVLVGGCFPNLEEEYIRDHTEHLEKQKSDEYSIDFHFEDASLIDYELMSDFIWVQKQIHNTVLPDDNSICHVMVFIPKDDNSLLQLCPSTSDNGCIQVLAMTDGKIIIIINKRRWAKKLGAVKTFLHELLHYVSYKIDGSGDGSHKRSEYWRSSGLLETVYNEWINHITD